MYGRRFRERKKPARTQLCILSRKQGIPPIRLRENFPYRKRASFQDSFFKLKDYNYYLIVNKYITLSPKPNRRNNASEGQSSAWSTTWG